PPLALPSFPPRRSSDLNVLAFLAVRALAAYYGEQLVLDGSDGLSLRGMHKNEDGSSRRGDLYLPISGSGRSILRFYPPIKDLDGDRKSTRLNSSHLVIS